jgi:D-xylose transport system permease protein
MSAPTTTPPGQPAPPPDRTPAALDPRLLVDEQGLRGYGTAMLRRVRGGELGSLPVIIGLLVIWIVFWSQQHTFISAGNLTNLAQQMISTGMISVGLVLVLLLGEVDLAVGSVSGVAGALVATQVMHGHSQALAITFGLLIGLGLGAIHGLFFSRLGVPAFVVTLAGFLAWEGLQLRILGTTGVATVQHGFINSLTSQYLLHSWGYGLAIIVLLLLALGQGYERFARLRAGLRPRPVAEIVFRLAIVAAIAFVSVWKLNQYKGMPISLVVFVLVVVLYDMVIRRTGYGRRVLAVGGNVEAARRAGISVPTIRLSVFMIAGLMASVGGIFYLSYQQSVDATQGGAQTVLYAIAAVVIGGTSLFGGRGSAYSALLGSLVITSISNGMALLGLTSSAQFLVTGGVTLAAVTLDSISRRSQRTSGRV